MKQSKFVIALDQAIKEGRLKEPFRPSDLRKAFGGFAHSTYGIFLPKHDSDNPDGNKVYFERVAYGLYRRLRD